jgi:hypothetical protein
MSDRYDKIRHDVAFANRFRKNLAWASSFGVKNPLLDRMDRESKTKLFWKWLQVLDSRVKWRAQGRFDPLLAA